MDIVHRSNGIIIRSFPDFQPMTTKDDQALHEALAELQEYHSNLQPAKWAWTNVILLRRDPDETRTARQPELLRVVAGAGTITSDGLDDALDYGYRVFIPQGVSYSLRGRVISGMNFRVVTLSLR
jgi:mannose-6-phosphate isomerase-like protein (cupin superfamily)